MSGRHLGMLVAAVVLGVITIVLLLTDEGEGERRVDAAGPVHIHPPAPMKQAVTTKPAEALLEAIGEEPGSWGRLFDGLVFGEPMPAAVQARVDDWQRRSGGAVRYDPEGDMPRLEVMLANPDVVRKTLMMAWGKVDLDWGAWSDPAGARVAILYDDGHRAGVIWMPYVTVEELLRPGDEERFGFEPIRLLGASITDVKAELGARLHARGPERYELTAVGSGSEVTVELRERGGVVEKVTAEFDVHSRSIGDQVLAMLHLKFARARAFTPKPGDPGTHESWEWELADRTKVWVSRSGTGQYRIELSR